MQYNCQLHRISFCADDKTDKRIFTFICKDSESNKHLCYVFDSEKCVGINIFQLISFLMLDKIIYCKEQQCSFNINLLTNMVIKDNTYKIFIVPFEIQLFLLLIHTEKIICLKKNEYCFRAALLH